MPRDIVALVSADDFVSAVRVYADRVNDLLRRSGVPALEAVEIVETHSLALLDAVVNAPETVIDLAGWWFARAIEFTSDSRNDVGLAIVEAPVSVLAGTLGEAEVRAALEALPDAERAVVVLRDGYDLPEQAVGVALRRGTESAADLTAAGRLDLVAAYDERPVPDLRGHTSRMTVDVVTLSRLADGTLEAPRAAPLRRHVTSCAACEAVLESLAKGRRLAAGLPITAMDDEARESLIDRVARRAEAVLPSHDAVLAAVDADHDPGPAVPPILAALAIVVAVALGVGVAMIRHADGQPGPVVTPHHTFQPSDPPTLPVPPSGRATRHRHTTAPPPPSTSAPPTRPPHPSRTPTTTADPTQSTAPPPPATPAISVAPTQGHTNSTFTVTGSGFKPDRPVRLNYAQGRSTATVTADADGNFTATLEADALLLGSHPVTAHGPGGRSASTTFTQEL